MGPAGPGSGTGSNPPLIYAILDELDTEVRRSDVTGDFPGSHPEVRRRVATANFTDSPADAGTPTPVSAVFFENPTTSTSSFDTDGDATMAREASSGASARFFDSFSGRGVCLCLPGGQVVRRREGAAHRRFVHAGT